MSEGLADGTSNDYLSIGGKDTTCNFLIYTKLSLFRLYISTVRGADITILALYEKFM
jgi:hypothetical protein